MLISESESFEISCKQQWYCLKMIVIKTYFADNTNSTRDLGSARTRFAALAIRRAVIQIKSLFQGPAFLETVFIWEVLLAEL